MTEQTKTMTEGDDPKDFDNDGVNAYLANASQEERARVLQAEADGKARVGILGGPYGTDQVGGGDDDPEAESQPTGTGASHQDGAPKALAKAADKAEELGKIGGKAKEYDYSQANSEVMGSQG